MKQRTLSAAAILTLLMCIVAESQSLDWSNDITVFGSPDDEHHPAIIISPGSGILRTLCIEGDSTISQKVSQDEGVSWGQSSDYFPQFRPFHFAGSADASYCYVVVYHRNDDLRQLFRFNPLTGGWNGAQINLVAPHHALPTEHLCVMTDFPFAPTDTYLNICWIERDSLSNRRFAWFAQSRNQGMSLLPESPIFETEGTDTAEMQVSMTAGWIGDDELLYVAADVERAGSIPPQMLIYISDDQGATWTARIIDSTAASQTEPAIAAYGSIVLAAYTRHSGFQTVSDVYFCFSLDAGATFTPTQAVASGSAREFAPRLVISEDGEIFHIFYLKEIAGSDSASLYVRMGYLEMAWELSEPVLVSAESGVIGAGGYAVATGPLGAAAVWTSPFVLGDTDVRFDASWRTAGVESRAASQSPSIVLGSCYPNPCNSSATFPITLLAAHDAAIDIVNVLGQRIMQINTGGLDPGEYRIAVDLSHFGSGIYFARVVGVEKATQRFILMR